LITKVRKRNGSYTKFDINKIIKAIHEAGKRANELDEKKATKLATRVVALVDELTNGHIPTVQQINDVVEQVLLASNYHQTAKEFIIYKYEHEKKNEVVNDFTKTLINKYVGNLDWKVKENANTGFSVQGLNHYIISNVVEDFWLNQIYDKEIREFHKEGRIHIHDLSHYGPYCEGWSIEDIIMEGFTGVIGKTSSNPPKHLSSLLGQMVNFIFTMSGEAAGAIAFSNFDTLLAPFLKEDNLSDKELEQQLQEFIFNLNVSTRTGFQTAFSNLTFDITVPNNYKEKFCLVGGEIKDYTYVDCQAEMNRINQAFFKVMMLGDGNGAIFSFPVVNVNITKEFDWDNPNLSNFWDSLSKYGLPTFSNYVNSDLSPDDAVSMCCRLRLRTDKLNHKGGGQFGASGKTGSVGVCTINLNRIGYEASNEDEFFSLLKNTMKVAGRSLKIKRELVEKLTEQGLYPYTKYYLRDIKERTGKYWTNHFNTIGLVGGHDACINLLGVGIGSDAGNKFMQNVLTFMNDVLLELQNEYGSIFNLEQTPAESAGRSLALKDLKYYKDIYVSGTKENPYLTNSTQLPVNYTEDLFEILDLQNELAKRYTGGSVVHLWIGERITEHNALKKLIKTITSNYNIPYFTLSPSFSICPKHGYLFGEHKYCPKCDIELMEKKNKECVCG
jgi:ribonucleoside-triphosphate reductase